MAISLPERRSLQRRDCRASLAMTGCAKWVRISIVVPLPRGPARQTGHTRGRDVTGRTYSVRVNRDQFSYPPEYAIANARDFGNRVGAGERPLLLPVGNDRRRPHATDAG